jgi:hypothetical protein
MRDETAASSRALVSHGPALVDLQSTTGQPHGRVDMPGVPGAVGRQQAADDGGRDDEHGRHAMLQTLTWVVVWWVVVSVVLGLLMGAMLRGVGE